MQGYANFKSLLNVEELKNFIKNDVVCPNLFIISSGPYSTPVCEIAQASVTAERKVKVIVFTGSAEMSKPLLTKYPELMHTIATRQIELVTAMHDLVS